jgi:hypothetical protein
MAARTRSARAVQAIGILRTEELNALHRYDGARQFFSSAYEFGYSFSVEETFQKWGRGSPARRRARSSSGPT